MAAVLLLCTAISEAACAGMEDVQKELEIRKRITGIYNKIRSEFESKEDYDNYLETTEDIIYKLTYNVDVAEAEQQVQDYIRQEAAAAGARTVANAAYAPAMTSMPAQPAPVGPVKEDKDGRLLPLNRLTGFSREQWMLLCQTSGWRQDMAMQRMLQEAFSTIFV
eukprot:GHRR01002849.1.p1 GENE.GHRR01002849.1~~GHRR01002849.1.p1  ORF type:complete len:165 (+),score=37.33 GHRR01002849.1:144-638(+)